MRNGWRGQANGGERAGAGEGEEIKEGDGNTPEINSVMNWCTLKKLCNWENDTCWQVEI